MLDHLTVARAAASLGVSWHTANTAILAEGQQRLIADVEYATAGWVDWYNHRRLHGSLGMVSPDEFEAGYYAALNRELLPA